MVNHRRGSAVSAPGLPVGADLRRLTPDDAPALALTSAQMNGADHEEYWRSKLEGATSIPWCYGIEMNGKLAAHILAYFDTAVGEEGAVRLEALGVDPAWQGHGLGRALTRALFEEAQARGIKKILALTDVRDSRMQAFLRALGFRVSRQIGLERRL